MRQNKFLICVCLFALVSLVCLFLLSIIVWLPPSFTLAGHDSGLPLNTKQFLLSRLYAWDDRLGFGLDNSANFGSLTIHFFDWLSSVIAGTSYAGNFVSLSFWLGLIFLSALIFAYQLKSIFGKPFVFILPFLVTFNFYIFQSVFMLERAKFGVFSATLISLAVFIRMQDRKLSVVTASVLSALIFSIFNGGGWFGITLYGGVVVILMVLILISLLKGLANSNFTDFKRISFFIGLSIILYFFLNAYSIIAYLQNFISADAPRLLQESSVESHIDWLRYVSRSTSLINLLRLFGVPDWYGEPNELIQVNISHPYAALYFNNKVLELASFIFPLLSFASFLLAKTKKQKQILSVFGFFTLLEIVFAAGSNSPFGFFYEFLMNHMPGFFLFRSAFYKFGVFYLFGMTVLFTFTVSLLIEKFINLFPNISIRFKNIVLFSLTFLIIGLWLSYHFVLFEPTKIFAWKVDQSTKMQTPDYIYKFDKFINEGNFADKRVLMIPPVNPEWESDAYNWGYWSLSPLPYALSSVRTLSNWHGLTSEELNLVDNLYNSIRINDEKSFSEQAANLNVGYILIRLDVLTDSEWSASEGADSYKAIITSFKTVSPVAQFGQWELYKLNSAIPMQVYTISAVNLTSDNFVSLVGQYFNQGHTIGLTDKKKYSQLDSISSNKVYAYDCLSCFLEKQVRLKILPDPVVLPGSVLYHFKEVREQKILNQSKDLRSKIANDLGFVLTRSAEQKKMLDLSVKEERLLNNAGVIRSYLSDIYSVVQSSKDYANDFELVSQILDFLNPVERVISDYMKTNVSSTHSHRFGEEMLGILWDINKIEDYFTPLLQDRERWSNEKVYKLTFPEPGNYNLSFSSKAFPKTLEGKVILPKEIKFMRDQGDKGNDERLLNLTEDKKNWLSVDLGFQDNGEGKLILYFEELPNLFSVEENQTEKFPFGSLGCLNGHIKNFDKKRAYEILISKTDRLRQVTAILRDKNKSYSDFHGFLKGEDLFEVPAVASGEFSRYVYFPSAVASSTYLYICSDDKNPPIIDKIVVREFFAPSALIIKKSDLSLPTFPSLNYTRINPISYIGEINEADNSFVLVFNEKINNLWKLSVSNGNGGWEVVTKHFMIDGYANGWFLDKGQARKFKIEYTPQVWFYIGSIISVTALLLSVLWLIIKNFKNKKI